jgi:hypothetical protein
MIIMFFVIIYVPRQHLQGQLETQNNDDNDTNLIQYFSKTNYKISTKERETKYTRIHIHLRQNKRTFTI